MNWAIRPTTTKRNRTPKNFSLMFHPKYVHHVMLLYIKTMFKATGRPLLHIHLPSLQTGLDRCMQHEESIPMDVLTKMMERIGYHRYSCVATETPVLSPDARSIYYRWVDDFCYTVKFDEIFTMRDMQHYKLITNVTELIDLQ